MPFQIGSVAVHSDLQHYGSAKRDALMGVAGIDASGYVLAPGGAILLTRTVLNTVLVGERTSGETVFYAERLGIADYDLFVQEAGAFKQLQTAGMKNVASGIAGLDANAQIPTAQMPPGIILPYGGAAAPTGWLLCDGSAVSRATYSVLFGILGTAYGVGDGSTTFNVPDFRGRAVLGAGQGSGLTLRSRGGTGGEETHVLTTAEMPSHTHSTAVIQAAQSTAGGVTAQPISGNTGSAGSDAAHNNMPPWAVATYIIKT